MYCPNCALEIKGAENDRCPICNSILIENPFESPLTSQDLSDTEARLKELIKDIDEKINMVEGSEDKNNSEEHVFTLNDIDMSSTEPSAKEFELKLDDVSDSSDSSFFNLTNELSLETPPSPRLHLEANDQMDKQKQASSSQTPVPEATSLSSDDSIFQHHETIQHLSDVTVGSKEEGLITTPDTSKPDVAITKQILDKALKEIEPEQTISSKKQKRSFALPVLFGALLFVSAVAAGLYMLNIFEEKSTIPSGKQLTTPPQMKDKQIVLLKTQGPSEHPTNDGVSGSKLYGTSVPDNQSNTQNTTLSDSAYQQPIAATNIPDEQKTQLTSTTIFATLEKSAVSSDAIAKEEQIVPMQPATPKKIPSSQTTATALQPGPGTFSIHAGSFRTRQIAEEEVHRLRDCGFDAFWDKANLGEKGEWYRIKIGVFSNKTEAEEALRRFLAKEPCDARIIKNK
ncbi:MAG: SPOR domain-containing protein [Desulfobacterota bacterium]|nr:SPOR domain-containing protein [Thermodesulfobacteriota bacterium]